MSADVATVRGAAKHLREGDTVRVVVLYELQRHKLPYSVELSCNRGVFPNPCARGGLGTNKLVGRCRTRLTAEKRANRVLAALQRERARPDAGDATTKEAR